MLEIIGGKMTKAQLHKKDYGINQMMRQLSSGELALPAIQRDYVWTDDQVMLFMESIYLERPLGGQFHIWEPSSSANMSLTGRTISGKETKDLTTDTNIGFIIDGQQRLTSLKRVYDDTLDGDLDLLFDPLEQKFLKQTSKNEKLIYPSEAPRSKVKYVQVRKLWTDPAYLQDLTRDDNINKFFVNKDPNEFKKFKDNSTKLAEILQALQFNCIILRGHDHNEIINIFILLNSAGKNVSTPEKIIMPMLIQSIPNIRKEIMEFIDVEIKKKYGDHYDSLIDINFIATTMMYQLYGYTNIMKNFKEVEYSEDEILKSFDIVKNGLKIALSKIDSHLGIRGKNMVESPFSLHVITLAFGNRLDEKNIAGKTLSLTTVEDNAAMLYFLVSNSKSRYSENSHMKNRKVDIEVAKENNALNRLAMMMMSYKVKGHWFRTDDLKNVFYQRTNHALMILLGIVLYKNGALAFHDGASVIDFRTAQKHHIFPRAKMIGIKNAENIANITYIHENPNGIEFSDRMPDDYLYEIRNLGGLSSDAKEQALKNHLIRNEEETWKNFAHFISNRQTDINDAFNKLLDKYAEDANV
jgi:hypothetical protein